MLVWRICKRRWVEAAFSGEGGLKSAARWHHLGNRIVYSSESLALATLETWVHLQQVKPVHPLADHVAVSAEIPDNVRLVKIDELALPDGWKENDAPSMRLRDIGTDWIKSLASAVACVPSAITPGAFNYLLNPLHGDFEKIRTREPKPFTFDSRMWKPTPLTVS